MEPDFDHIDVRDNREASRYEARIGAALAVLDYERSGNHIALTHTGVPKALEGHGIAARLTRFALDDARARGLEVIPECSYAVAYLRRHPDDLDVVAPQMRERLTRKEA